MDEQDYYRILGVEGTATPEQIKIAFKKKAASLHPDNKDTGDKKAFDELIAAYEALSKRHPVAIKRSFQESQTKIRRLFIATAAILAFLTALVKLPMLRTSLPASVVRWCLGEPGATQWVNNTADTIVDSGWSKDLEMLADQLIRDFAASSKLGPKYEYDDRCCVLPLNRLPLQYQKLGGFVYGAPDLLLRTTEKESATLVICWGHGREEVLIFRNSPAVSPHGFFVRKVTDRIYVVANES